MKRVVRNCIIMLLAGALAGTLLLTISFMLPVREQVYQQSVETLEKEGWYPAMPVMSASLDTYFHSFLPGVLDGNTDRIMIDTALDTTKGNPLYRAMDMYSTYMREGYSYYWHGYVSILRPLMLFFDYGEIRILNGVLQLLLIFAVTYLIYKKKNRMYAGIFLTSYFLLMPVAVGFSLQFSWVFYISMLGCLLILKLGDHLSRPDRMIYLFLGLGMCTSFLDLLTYPLYTWAIPLLWWIVTDETCMGKVRRVIGIGVAWIAGYGGLWILKWCLGTLILKRNILESAINEVFVRSGLEEVEGGGLSFRLEALLINWKHYSYKLYFIVLIAWLVYFMVRSISGGFKRSSSACALTLTGSSAVVWYLVLANHTNAHHFFTYRIWGITVLAVLLLAAECTGKAACSFQWKHASIWGGLGSLTIILTLFAREDLFVLNGYCKYELLELQEETQFKTEFVPTFSVINELCLGLDTQSQEGEYEIRLCQDGTVLEQNSIPMEEVGMLDFYSIEVDWKLKSGEKYELIIETQGNTEPAYLMVTVPEEMPLTEFKNASAWGETVGGQPISGITYRKLPGKKNLLFICMTWMWILMAIYLTGYSVFLYSIGKKQRKDA